MSITFSQTARDVVTGAMRDLGIIRLGAAPKAAELAYGIEQLDLMLKALAIEGLSPWTDEETSVTFLAEQSEVTLTPRPAEVSEARVIYAGGYSRVLRRLSSGEYDRYPNRAQSGIPVAFEIRQTTTAVKMRVWPVPTASTEISYSYSRFVEDVSENTPLDLPQVWGMAIREMLKARLTAFGPVDPAVEMRAEMMKLRLLDFARPESYQVGVDW